METTIYKIDSLIELHRSRARMVRKYDLLCFDNGLFHPAHKIVNFIQPFNLETKLGEYGEFWVKWKAGNCLGRAIFYPVPMSDDGKGAWNIETKAIREIRSRVTKEMREEIPEKVMKLKMPANIFVLDGIEKGVISEEERKLAGYI